jgi:hypothetical protein
MLQRRMGWSKIEPMGTFLSALRNALVATAVCLVALVVMGAGTAEAFCESPIVDYAAPLQGLPKLGAIYTKGQRTIGGRSIWVSGLAIPKAVAATPEVAFSISPAFRPSLPRGWALTGSLTRVTSTGAPAELIARKRQSTSAVKPRREARMSLGVRHKHLSPGIYRYSLSIDSGRHHLALLGGYFRLLRSRPLTRLSIERPDLTPGETAAVCLENPGTAAVQYGIGPPLRVDRATPDGWIPTSIALPSGYVTIADLGLLEPGEAVRAFVPEIPLGTQPGSYRFFWEGETDPAPVFRLFGLGEPITASAEFTVR